MSVPTARVSVICPCPSLDELSILMTPSRVLSCSSCSWTISRSTSTGLAPGQRVVMVITGSSTSGVSCTGSRNSAITPNITSRMTPTVVDTGFLIDERMTLMGGGTPGAHRERAAPAAAARCRA